MLYHLGIDIESIDIVQVFLDITWLLEITYLVKSPVHLIVVAIALANVVLNLLPRVEPYLVRLPPLQRISFCTSGKADLSLSLILGLYDVEIIIHLDDPSL